MFRNHGESGSQGALFNRAPVSRESFATLPYLTLSISASPTGLTVQVQKEAASYDEAQYLGGTGCTSTTVFLIGVTLRQRLETGERRRHIESPVQRDE